MNPSDYRSTYMRNSINPDRFRPYIPGYAWPIKHYPYTLRQIKKQTLCLKEYKRIIKRKRNRHWRTASMRAIRKLLHKMHPKRLNPLYREVQMKGTFHQPSYEQIKWEFIDFPDKIKQFLCHSPISGLEQSYLAYLKNKPADHPLSPIEAAIACKIDLPRKDPTGIIRFANGNEMLVPYPTPEDGKGLHLPYFRIVEETTKE